jgi:general secretion pathway protein I
LKLFHAIPPIDRGNAGFTIIEVLIALAVVAVSIVAIGSVMSTNVRGVRSLEQHVTLMQTVRSVMTGELPPRAELGFGALSGTASGHRWKIDVGPMDEEWNTAGADVAWMPALVRIQVRSPSGAVSDLKTVRLIHGPAK